MSPFERKAQDRGPGNLFHEARHLLHPLLCLRRPGDAGLRLDVHRRIEFPAGHQHVAGGQPQQVLAVGADIHAIIAVHPDLSQDQHPRFRLADVPEDPVERLPIQQSDLQVCPLIARDLAGDFEVRLVDLGQAGVDDLLVQLLLLLELEDLGRLLCQDIGKAVEHRIV